MTGVFLVGVGFLLMSESVTITELVIGFTMVILGCAYFVCKAVSESST